MDVEQRARMLAALGDPLRLAIADDLALSDRAPIELAERHGLATNLLAHHLDVLERAGLIERSFSSGDGRRRYVRLRHEALDGVGVRAMAPDTSVVLCARTIRRGPRWQRRCGQRRDQRPH